MANKITSTEVVVRDDYVEDIENEPARDEYVPDGWKTQEEFLSFVRETFDADAGYDRDNRKHALEDLQFLAGDQWDPTVLKSRTDKGRPCLTINVLPQFVGQVIGDRRMNKTSIKVMPKKDASSAEAEVRSGIIKGIESDSRADRVYDATCEDQVACGIGHFRIDLDYASNDVFDQDIRIRHIPNPLAVVWDRMHTDPTGRDARHCWVQDIMPRDVYEKAFPDHPAPGQLGDESDMSTTGVGWFDNDVVRITEFWQMKERPATFALMQDGDVKDVTGMKIEEYQDQLWRDPETMEPKIRESFRTYACMHLVTGFAILSQAYELPLDRLPIIKAEGRVVRVGEDRVRFGLVRYAKDSQRLKNYWRSVAAETLALAPKAQWVAEENAVEGRESDWQNAHQTGDTLLIHNKGTQKPERADPPTVPAALLQEAQMNQQDIKDTTGLHDASLGMRSNEISGRAIQARQSEGDVATIIYHDNLNAAILEGGDVINQLIPIAYDTQRTVLVIGDDDKRKLMTINDPTDEESPAIGTGKYDVSLQTGPSFATQREEAREAMTMLVQTAPELFQVAGDLIVKNQDWPGASEIAERLRKKMQEAGIVEPDEDEQQQEQMDPQAILAQVLQSAEVQEVQAQQEHATKLRELELQEKQATVAKITTEGQRADEDNRKAEAEARRAEADARRAEAAADREEAMARRAQIEARAAPLEAAQRIDLAERAASAKSSDRKDRGTGSRPGGDRQNRRTKKEPK